MPRHRRRRAPRRTCSSCGRSSLSNTPSRRDQRSEEHTSELQSQSNLVCRLLLEKKKTIIIIGSLQRRVNLLDARFTEPTAGVAQNQISSHDASHIIRSSLEWQRNIEHSRVQ